MNKIFFACFLFMTLSACHSAPEPNSIVGQWQIQPGPLREFARMTFRPDGEYWLNYGKDIISEVYGTYHTTNDTVMIQYTTNTGDPDCSSPGVYRFRVVGDELRFTFVQDPCTMRRGNHILYPWYRVEKEH
jgi:hypothetical protein